MTTSGTTIALGAVADDYTGASDLASMLSLNGLRTIQTIGVPREDLELPDADAIVVSLKSRSIEACRAVRLSLEAEHWLRARGAAHVLFKICSTFDSTDAGNIGPVTDALRERAREEGRGGGPVLVNPSFPENNRTVFQGHLFVADRLLHETPMKDHPLNPMRDSDLVRVLARQSSGTVALVPFAIVEQGADAVRAALARAGAEGAVAAIADSVAARHLDAIGEAALDGPLSTGASGLGSSLARALVRRGQARAAASPPSLPRPPASGGALVLAGSCSAATLRQIGVAEGDMPVRHLDVERLLDGPGETEAAIAWAREHVARGPALIASSGTAEQVRALQARHGGERVGHAVEQALADIAEALASRGLSRLVVAGGESSGAVVDRLGLEAFVIGEAIAPGVPILHTVGARHPGLTLALKSGNFGTDDFFARALGMMRP